MGVRTPEMMTTSSSLYCGISVLLLKESQPSIIRCTTAAKDAHARTRSHSHASCSAGECKKRYRSAVAHAGTDWIVVGIFAGRRALANANCAAPRAHAALPLDDCV